MEPNTSMFQQPQQNAQSRRNFIIIAVLTILVIVVVVASLFAGNTGFRVVGTDPKLSSVPNYIPYMNVKFSEKISSKDISISSSPDITESHSVKDETLKIVFKKDKLKVGNEYVITIKSIRSESGEVLTDEKLKFTAKDVDLSSLSEEMQTAAINTQDKPPYSPNSYAFEGVDVLVDDYGLTAYATEGLRQAVFNYGKSINEQVDQAILYKGSITTTIVDPAQDIGAVNFTLDINDKTFSAQLNHWDLTKVRLYLRDTSTDAQVFDSGDIDKFDSSTSL